MEQLDIGEDYPLLEKSIIPDAHLAGVCRYRCGPACCKYVFFSRLLQEFCCLKKIPSAKGQVDEIAKEIKAQGDNCEGLPNEAE